MGRLIDTSELAKHIALQKKRFGNLLEVPICNVFADMIRDTPTAKAIPKANVYKAIQEMMKYEHEGFINISLAKFSEIIQQQIDAL